MPLVLAENERTIGGLYDSWQDTTGREYHFPNVYRRKVEADDGFVVIRPEFVRYHDARIFGRS